jgi:histidinol-phosphate/aromatic aminotransferase/cobyric acid decarboxylase-like protein
VIASDGVAEQVRELVVPMQVGELALQGALRLLAAGDVFDRLRTRIRAVKPVFVARLAAAGLRVIHGHEDIPWVAVTDPDGSARRFLAERGIRGLLPVPVPGVASPAAGLLHLTVPLSGRRIALFQELISADCAAVEVVGRPV